MEDEYRLSAWHVLFKRDSSPLILDSKDQPIATVHGSEDEVLPRAMLIAKAPSLLDAAKGALMAFKIIAEHEKDNPAGLASKDYIPVLEAALYGIDGEGLVS